jgi:hypothetical protein
MRVGFGAGARQRLLREALTCAVGCLDARDRRFAHFARAALRPWRPRASSCVLFMAAPSGGNGAGQVDLGQLLFGARAARRPAARAIGHVRPNVLAPRLRRAPRPAAAHGLRGGFDIGQDIVCRPLLRTPAGFR